MFTDKLQARINATVVQLQKFADRIWYTPLIGLLAALDNLVIIIPNDGILISSSMLAPRRWFLFALSVAIGSALGALVLAALVEVHGLPWVLQIYPGLAETSTWAWTSEFFAKYGLLVVFGVALTPSFQQPAVILASLANTPLMELTLVIFVGRFIKFLIMAYIGSHSPHLLKKLWGVKGELKDVGVKLG